MRYIVCDCCGHAAVYSRNRKLPLDWRSYLMAASDGTPLIIVRCPSCVDDYEQYTQLPLVRYEGL